jgi:hypothetical protein
MKLLSALLNYRPTWAETIMLVCDPFVSRLYRNNGDINSELVSPLFIDLCPLRPTIVVSHKHHTFIQRTCPMSWKPPHSVVNSNQSQDEYQGRVHMLIHKTVEYEVTFGVPMAVGIVRPANIMCILSYWTCFGNTCKVIVDTFCLGSNLEWCP